MVPDRGGFEAFYGAHLPRIVRACTLALHRYVGKAVYRQQPEMLLYILNSIRIEEA